MASPISPGPLSPTTWPRILQRWSCTTLRGAHIAWKQNRKSKPPTNSWRRRRQPLESQQWTVILKRTKVSWKDFSLFDACCRFLCIVRIWERERRKSVSKHRKSSRCHFFFAAHCEKEKVEGFPTLRLYHKGKMVKDYEESPPTTDGVVKYMMAPPLPKDELWAGALSHLGLLSNHACDRPLHCGDRIFEVAVSRRLVLLTFVSPSPSFASDGVKCPAYHSPSAGLEWKKRRPTASYFDFWVAWELETIEGLLCFVVLTCWFQMNWKGANFILRFSIYIWAWPRES